MSDWIMDAAEDIAAGSDCCKLDAYEIADAIRTAHDYATEVRLSDMLEDTLHAAELEGLLPTDWQALDAAKQKWKAIIVRIDESAE